MRAGPAACARRAASLLLAILLPALSGHARAQGPGPRWGGETLPHPIRSADLEGQGFLVGCDPALLDYHLGPVKLARDYLTRDLVLLTATRVQHLRIRAASVARLNEQTMMRLRQVPVAAGVPRRLGLPRLKIPRGLARHRSLIRLLALGTSERVEDIRLHLPRRDALFVHLRLSYRAGGDRRRVQRGGSSMERVLIEALSALFPGGGEL